MNFYTGSSNPDKIVKSPDKNLKILTFGNKVYFGVMFLLGLGCLRL